MQSIERSIDNFGRIPLPKAIRESLGITEKTILSVNLDEGRIVLMPIGEMVDKHPVYFENRD